MCLTKLKPRALLLTVLLGSMADGLSQAGKNATAPAEFKQPLSDLFHPGATDVVVSR